MAKHKHKSKYVTIVDLAERLNIDRSWLHKKVQRERVATIKVRRKTRGGVQLLVAVPRAYADELTKQYREAEQ